MPRGGARPNAGRAKGGTNKKSREVAIKARANGLTPVEYMTQVFRNERLPIDQRLDAAKAVAPYMHPRLNATTVSGDKDAPLRLEVLWGRPE